MSPDEKHPQRCDHWKVCRIRAKLGEQTCDSPLPCMHDTRRHSSSSAGNASSAEGVTVGMVTAYEAGQRDAEQRIADAIRELEQTLEYSKKQLYGLNSREAEWISGREAGLEEAISLLKGDGK